MAHAACGKNGAAKANLLTFGHLLFFERSTMSDTRASVEAQEQLVSDIKSVISDAEEMLSATADQVGDKVATLRARVQTRLHDAKVRLGEAEAVLVAKTKAAARATDAYVHESPWTSIGVAAGVGLLLGLVISRR
jgi:ElaB/YqjD/DUF883 family membrane-anchored ribosome-binding protein